MVDSPALAADPPRGGRSAGLTLTELLVVIAILAALAGMLVPLIGWVRTRAQQTACSSNLVQLGAAVRIYAELEGGRIPASQNWGASTPERSSAWFNQLPKLLSERKVSRPGGIFQCPAFSGAPPGLLRAEVPKSYKMNLDIDRVRNGPRGWRHRAFFIDRISDGSTVVLFSDAITSGGKGQWGYGGVGELDDTRHPGWVGVLFSDGRTARTPGTAEARAGTPALRWRSADWE